ncbi:MAG TPA: erythromycin esterase family protein, partial [Longimicrobium sp.]|nr:erythromycin esterase family protein [Longimicrobium sp.]
EWGAPMQRMPVPRAREGTWEAVFHAAGAEDRLLLLDRLDDVDEAMEERGHRAIGVVYHPGRERFGNYVPTILPGRYDVMLHIDRTRALQPLHMEEHPLHEPPETFPSGM